jgi:hypothetical protein
MVEGDNDGLEAVEGRERAGPGLLGEQQRGASAGMADADRAFEAERIDGR